MALVDCWSFILSASLNSKSSPVCFIQSPSHRQPLEPTPRVHQFVRISNGVHLGSYKSYIFFNFSSHHCMNIEPSISSETTSGCRYVWKTESGVWKSVRMRVGPNFLLMTLAVVWARPWDERVHPRISVLGAWAVQHPSTHSLAYPIQRVLPHNWFEQCRVDWHTRLWRSKSEVHSTDRDHYEADLIRTEKERTKRWDIQSEKKSWNKCRYSESFTLALMFS